MKKSVNHLFLIVLNAVVFICLIIINSLASILPLGGLNTGEISDLYPNLFVPSGLTFSIWALIYLLLALYVIYSFFYDPNDSRHSDSFIDKIGFLFFISSLANICWIISWHFRQIMLSIFCMLILLVTLIAIYQSLSIGKSHVSKREKLIVHLAFSIYLGWISVATIANVTAFLVEIKWTRFGMEEQSWTIILIGIALILGLIFLFIRNDIAYASVILWAFIGILLKRVSLVHINPNPLLINSVIGGIVLLSVSILFKGAQFLVFKKRNVL